MRQSNLQTGIMCARKQKMNEKLEVCELDNSVFAN